MIPARDDAPSESASPPLWARLLVAVALGLVATGYAAHVAELRVANRLGLRFSDFAHLWFAARRVLTGQDVYRAIGPGREFDPGWALAYPMPAVLVATPMRWMSEVGADAAFAGVGIGLLAFVLLARGWWGIIPLFAWPTIKAVQRVQWSPLLTAAAVAPWLGGLLVAKPNIGLALACYKPTRAWLLRAALGGAVLLGVSFVLQPHWMDGWLQAIRTPPARGISSGAAQSSLYEAPITCFGGPIALLALLRWRRPEARLIVASSLVPQALVGYELVPLVALVPARRVEALALSLSASLVPIAAGPFMRWDGDWAATFRVVGTASVWLVYLPLVLLVLARPNEGEVPARLNRIAQRAADRLPRLRRARPHAETHGEG